MTKGYEYSGMRPTYMECRSTSKCSETTSNISCVAYKMRGALTVTMPILRSILSSWLFRTSDTHRMNAFSHAYSLMLVVAVSTRQI